MTTRQFDWGSISRTILLHILFWIFIVTYFAWGFGFNDNPLRSFINASFFLPGFFIMVYSLLYVLVPRYLLTKRFLLFFTGLIIVLAICSLYTVLAQLSLDDSKSFRGMTISIGKNVLPFLHVGGIALSIKLLLPFVENAFKHGTSKQLDQSWISLNLVMEGSVMYFKVINSVEPDAGEKQSKIGGLGLLNAKRRLELLYKDKYVFETKRLEDVFVVDLEVKLEELEEQYAEMEMPYRG